MVLKMRVLKGTYSVCKLAPNADVPKWLYEEPWYSVTKTGDELSIVCKERDFDHDVIVESGWKCLAIEGPLDFGLVGILSTVSSLMAKSQISIFAISTYNTDYILVKKSRINEAIIALKNNGIEIAVD